MWCFQERDLDEVDMDILLTIQTFSKIGVSIHMDLVRVVEWVLLTSMNLIVHILFTEGITLIKVLYNIKLLLISKLHETIDLSTFFLLESQLMIFLLM